MQADTLPSFDEQFPSSLLPASQYTPASRASTARSEPYRSPVAAEMIRKAQADIAREKRLSAVPRVSGSSLLNR